uniref:Uncharacterized protein n=1 Tax=Clytia hemisphaerica TaxID=252671 RepID=A0A7M5XHY6_9CNID
LVSSANRKTWSPEELATFQYPETEGQSPYSGRSLTIEYGSRSSLLESRIPIAIGRSKKDLRASRDSILSTDSSISTAPNTNQRFIRDDGARPKKVRMRSTTSSGSLKTTGKFSDGTRPRGRTITSRPKSCEIRLCDQDSFDDGTFDSGIYGASSPNDESDSSIKTKTKYVKRELVKLKGSAKDDTSINERLTAIEEYIQTYLPDECTVNQGVMKQRKPRHRSISSSLADLTAEDVAKEGGIPFHGMVLTFPSKFQDITVNEATQFSIFDDTNVVTEDLKELSKKVFDSEVMDDLFKTSTRANQEVFKSILTRSKSLEELTYLIGTHMPTYMVSSLIKCMVSLNNAKGEIYNEVEHLIKKCIRHTEKRKTNNDKRPEMDTLKVNEGNSTPSRSSSFSKQTAV